MAKFVTIGYGDQEGYDRTDAAVRDRAHAHDSRLRAAGADMGIAGSPVQVRNHDGAGMSVESGSFMSSALPVAGFMIIEAETLEEAVQLVSMTPCAVAHGVVEVWPLRETPEADG
ncbi:YciI family protein [Actinoallomurus oryzae]|uniref:YciI family protein n=1 Tax=Actinoallomurus oryzae TaxID=502180 RepID=A0ABP8PKC4_9ACTN